MSGRKRIRATVWLGIALVLMGAGAAFLLAPLVGDALFRYEASMQVAEVKQVQETVQAAASGPQQLQGSSTSAQDAADAQSVDPQQLLAAREGLEVYNKQVAAGQRALAADPFGFEEAVGTFDVSVLEDGLVGSIDIPAMDCSLPLYLGASYDHMARGATVVEGSSAPLGGASTNCVIAGHRGWNQTAMFRDIERLQLGDTVTLHTVWEDLTYTVAGIRIISPADTQAVRVREGLDLVTLVTCHPYGYNYQRYVVYCVRDDSAVLDASQADGSADIFGVDKPERDVGEGGADAVLGNPAFEDALRITGVAVLAVCFCIVLTRIRARR